MRPTAWQQRTFDPDWIPIHFSNRTCLPPNDQSPRLCWTFRLHLLSGHIGPVPTWFYALVVQIGPPPLSWRPLLPPKARRAEETMHTAAKPKVMPLTIFDSLSVSRRFMNLSNAPLAGLPPWVYLGIIFWTENEQTWIRYVIWVLVSRLNEMWIINRFESGIDSNFGPFLFLECRAAQK